MGMEKINKHLYLYGQTVIVYMRGKMKFQLYTVQMK